MQSVRVAISHHPGNMNHISTPLHSASFSAHSILSIPAYKSTNKPTNNGGPAEILCRVCTLSTFLFISKHTVITPHLCIQLCSSLVIFKTAIYLLILVSAKGSELVVIEVADGKRACSFISVSFLYQPVSS